MKEKTEHALTPEESKKLRHTLTEEEKDAVRDLLESEKKFSFRRKIRHKPQKDNSPFSKKQEHLLNWIKSQKIK